MGPHDFGYSRAIARRFQPILHAGELPARVISLHTDRLALATGMGERWAPMPRAPKPAASKPDLPIPAVGDWVVVMPPENTGDRDAPFVVRGLLDRTSKLSRKVAGARSSEQVVAANVDTVLLVMGLDGDFNLRRLERFATMAWSSGAQPVVILTKADLVDDLDSRIVAVEAVVPGMPVHAIAALASRDLEGFEPYLEAGATLALVGSSGVGKSTLINALLGHEAQRVGAVRDGDDRGRHTTTHREMIRLPGGALIIDNPGVRELQLWADEETALGLERTFEDVQSLAARCRFGDCKHDGEPGCAVRAAIESGDLDAARLESYRGLERELRYQARRQDVASRRAADRKQGAFYKSVLSAKRHRRW